MSSDCAEQGKLPHAAKLAGALPGSAPGSGAEQGLPLLADKKGIPSETAGRGSRAPTLPQL